MGYEKKKKRKVMSGPQPVMVDWELEEDLRALTRAKAVEADPERMKKVKELARKKLAESQRKKDEAQEAINLAAGA